MIIADGKLTTMVTVKNQNYIKLSLNIIFVKTNLHMLFRCEDTNQKTSQIHN